MLILLPNQITYSRHIYSCLSSILLLSSSVSPYVVAKNFEIGITLNLKLYNILTWFKERIRKEYMNLTQKIDWNTWTLCVQL